MQRQRLQRRLAQTSARVLGSGERREVAVLALGCAVALAVAMRTDSLESLIAWAHQYEEYELDELLSLFFFLPFAFGTLAQRRLTAQRHEAALRERAETALRDSEARLRLALSAAGMTVWERDVRTNRVTHVEVSEGELLQASVWAGHPHDDFASFLQTIHADDRERVVAANDAAVRDGADLAVEFRLSAPSNAQSDAVRWEYAVGRAVRGADGDVDRLVGVSLDVTERKRLEAQLIHQAYHDPLTGLANRTRMLDRVRNALDRPDRRADRVAVLFLDVDHFKSINDSLGHEAGDSLLQTVADRLLHATRGSDTVARLGGDEFAVLLANVQSDDNAIVVAQRITLAMEKPVTLGSREVHVGTSIGIARARAGDDADALLRNADLAMYTAKREGRGRYAAYEPGMHAAAIERLELEADLRAACDGGEFDLLFQPVIELRTGRLVGAEALVRWQHPERGLTLPATFIPVAEETGLILPLGQWVLAEACRQAAAWGRNAPTGTDDSAPTISVNLSGRQLDDPLLVTSVDAALRDSGLAPHRLTLEITESAVMRRTEVTLERLRALKAIGVQLAIDDFGTGYSSLSYLQRFPVDVLKIDKSFVDGVASEAHDEALARTIIALGTTLGLRTVAEGIETEEQRAALHALGCEYGQGYHFARPLSAADFARQLAAPAPRDLAVIPSAATRLRRSTLPCPSRGARHPMPETA